MKLHFSKEFVSRRLEKIRLMTICANDQIYDYREELSDEEYELNPPLAVLDEVIDQLLKLQDDVNAMHVEAKQPQPIKTKKQGTGVAPVPIKAVQ